MNAKVHTHPLWIQRGGTLMPAEEKCGCVGLCIRMSRRKKRREREEGEGKEFHIHLKTLKF